MASRFWVGGSGNWDAATTTNWSATSGGGGGASVPTSADDVTFDSLSNATAYTVTVTATANCKSLTIGNPASGVITFAGGSALNIFGSYSLATGLTLTHNGLTTFKATSGTVTLTFNGVTMPGGFNIDGVGGTFQLADNLTSAASISLLNGTFDPNGKLVTLTAGSPLGAWNFYDLTITGAANKTDFRSLSANITVTHVLTMNGNSSTNRLLIQSNTTGTARTITAASVSAQNLDLMDITGAGAASWDLSAITGLSGDCGGNTLQALGSAGFTVATTQHFTNTSGGTWSTAANWTSRVPLPQDTVLIDTAFTTSRTVTADMPRLGGSIDFTGATWTTSLTFTLSTAASIFGSLTLIDNLTLGAATQTLTFQGRGSYTLHMHSLTFEKAVTLNAPSGTLTLAANMTLGVTRTLTLTNGTLDVSGSNYVVSAGLISMSSGATFNMQGATHLLTGTGSVFTGAGTITPGTSTLKINDTSNTAITFAGGGKTYNNVYFSRGASTASLTISGSNTFNDFKDDGTAAHSILFTAGTTQHVTSWSVNGTSGNLITINSTTTAIHTLTKDNGGIVSADFLNIQHSVVGPGKWYAGLNSVNNQATSTAGSGWVFDIPPIPNIIYQKNQALKRGSHF